MSDSKQEPIGTFRQNLFSKQPLHIKLASNLAADLLPEVSSTREHMQVKPAATTAGCCQA
jgi:hypothetical protein